MKPDDVVEAFVSTIVFMVMLVILAQIWYPAIGDMLVGILPGFVEFLAYLMVVGVLLAMLYQLIE